jgi:hypothetical protein
MPLVRLKSAYRRIGGPLLQFIEATESDYPRRLIAVLTLSSYWWQHLLHADRAATCVPRSCSPVARASSLQCPATDKVETKSAAGLRESSATTFLWNTRVRQGARRRNTPLSTGSPWMMVKRTVPKRRYRPALSKRGTCPSMAR